MELFASTYASEMEYKQRTRVEQLALRGCVPTLAILQTVDSKVIDVYVRVKKKYAEKIGVRVIHEHVAPENIYTRIEGYNQNADVHGVIVQLPLDAHLDASSVLGAVHPKKDVDGLHGASEYIPPTAQAIRAFFDIAHKNPTQEKIAVVGYGKLVGQPTAKLLESEGVRAQTFVKGDSLLLLQNYSTIISGVGVPGIIHTDLVAPHTLIIDAGTAEDAGTIVGDVDLSLYDRSDALVSARKGGVGMLTVRYLFENVILAAEKGGID